ncbi:HSP20 family protein [Selenomonas sp. GACV-9]|uniref:Hsp20 family protein n=1 Tax=Selenomonas sp. GACV-9 TaxID=3158782 RepID=UPI0008DF7D20|nr:HSP20 family protein [Selenomonas ruminantium]
MFRTIPFNLRENAERGREVLEKALEFMADQPFNPMGRVSSALSPFRVDVIDTETAYELFAELPGFYKEQINVSYDEHNYLRIRAERPESESQLKYLCHERRTGEYERTFLIDGIKEEDVSVSYENGILHIIMPKEQAKDNRTVFDID